MIPEVIVLLTLQIMKETKKVSENVVNTNRTTEKFFEPYKVKNSMLMYIGTFTTVKENFKRKLSCKMIYIINKHVRAIIAKKTSQELTAMS